MRTLCAIPLSIMSYLRVFEMNPFARQTTTQAFEPPGNAAADSSGHLDRAEQRAPDANSDLRKESEA